jgi:hypothetical protein
MSDSQMASLNLGTVLTIILVASACITVLGFLLGQIQFNREEYQSEMRYSFTRIPLRYDYSCDEDVYGLYVNLSNNGSKMVQGLQASITNALCVGGTPPLPSVLKPNQSIQFYVYSTEQNGTLTVSGNNTDVFIRF